MLIGLARPVCSIYDENILPAIVIIIDERHPGTHRLRKILLPERGVIVDEVDAGFLRDVAKGY